jgi:hypothetical protein
LRPFALAAALAVVALGAPARAYDFAVNAGAVEVVTLPDRQHVGFYPYVGFSFVFPFRRVALIPSLTVEAAPETGHWGFVGSLVADFPVHPRLGLDVDVTLLHDQFGGDFRSSEFFLGAGVGFSLFVGNWTISPYTNIFRDLSADGWAIVPGLNFAITP